MSGRRRVAATFATVLLLAACAGPPSEQAPPASWQLARAASPVTPVVRSDPVATLPTASRLAELAAELWSLGNELSDLSAEVAVAERAVRPTDGAVRRARREFGSRSQLAASTRVPAGGASVTLAELVAPLQAVSDAMNAGDRLHAALLESQGSLRTQEVAASQLASRVRSLRSELVLREREMAMGLAVSARPAPTAEGRPSAGSDPSAGSGLVPDAVGQLRAQLHRAQVAELELRQVDGRVKALSVQLSSRREVLIRDVALLRDRMDLLDAHMARMEALVGARYGIWADGSEPIIGPFIDGVLQVCPVDPPHAYSDDFGAPRWAGGFHPHQGNDIFAPEGTPIRAPFPGTAVDASNTLGGKAVKVYGRSGYVYNAHLVRFGRLGQVRVGDVIGYVGNTGDAIGTAPHDHFEWHPGGGSAVDPYPYLNAVCLPPSS